MLKDNNQKFVNIAVYYDAVKDTHSHRDVELIYALEGEINLTIEDQTYAMKKEDIVVVNSGKNHSISKAVFSDGRPLIASIKISYGFLSSCMGGRPPLFWCVSMSDVDRKKYDDLRDLLHKMLKDYAVNKEKMQLIQYSQNYYLLHILTNYFAASSEESEQTEEEKRIDKIRLFIEENYDADISLTDLAEYTNLSLSYLSRYFKKSFGMNFIDYIYDVRIQKARDQLASTNDEITDIAYNNGFPNVASLNKRFKEKYGDSPSAFRKKLDISAPEVDVALSSKRAMEILADYFEISDVPVQPEDFSDGESITADISDYHSFAPVWCEGMNLGPAENVLEENVITSIEYAKEALDFTYGRITNIFSPSMFMIGEEGAKNGYGRFYRLDRILYFMLKNKIIPIRDY